MPKAPIIEIEAIESATQFDATIFLGTGRYRSESFDTLTEAREAAIRFAAEARNGRKGMVYAISAGRSVFVPDSYQPTMNEGASTMIKTQPKTATQLSGQQLSQLSAMITGGGFKRANSRDAAHARFVKLATEAGIKSAVEIADGPYDMAEHVIAEHKAGRHMTIAEVKANRTEAPSEELRTRNRIGGKANKVAEVKGEPSLQDQIETAKAKRLAAKPAKAAGGKRAAAIETAQAGNLPEAPNFSANTHKPHRKKLADVVALVEKGDVKALKAFPINPVSSSRKAIAKYRDLAVIALEAQAAAKKEAA